MDPVMRDLNRYLDDVDETAAVEELTTTERRRCKVCSRFYSVEVNPHLPDRLPSGVSDIGKCAPCLTPWNYVWVFRKPNDLRTGRRVLKILAGGAA